MEIWPGTFLPLGATPDAGGTNFAVFTEAAEAVELCLFDASGAERRVELPESRGYVWHGYVPGVGPGQRYGLRVHGPWTPERGRLCNPQKLLVDPYARAIEGDVSWGPAVYGHEPKALDRASAIDSAPFVPRSLVVDGRFDWGEDRPLRTPWHKTVIYELHVRGFTRLHPAVPPELRGTYAGLAHPAVLEHLTRLGVTAVELMPVHHFVNNQRLADLGLRNYWGYDSIGYFAPHGAYARAGQPGGQVAEFKRMVRALHEAGLEVILDVVYNHTGEGGVGGPTLCFRGLDNASYYRLDPEDPRRYVDYTGCGNSLNMREPHVLQLIMDSLRYWIEEMHVDGFRFDLASALARELHAVDRLSAFFDIIQQDPSINRVKLIAEPWDVGEGGYHVGNFPPLWSEWNGKYRDTVRDFWSGREQTLPELANRLTGSSDLYASTGRRPFASVNFVTCHDGFTLRDLFTYEQKRNLANAENNRDGESHNRSWNCGVEGETDDPDIRALRARQQRNVLATLLLSQGVPMLLAGDELGRTQHGNNNAYCQDNEISWLDWEHTDEELHELVRALIALRRDHPVLRRRQWFLGRAIHGSSRTDIGWYRPDGTEMAEADWRDGLAKALGVFLNGEEIATRDARGRRILDDDFVLLLDAHAREVVFTLPQALRSADWIVELDTSGRRQRGEAAADELALCGHSVLVLRRPR